MMATLSIVTLDFYSFETWQGYTLVPPVLGFVTRTILTFFYDLEKNENYATHCFIYASETLSEYNLEELIVLIKYTICMHVRR